MLLLVTSKMLVPVSQNRSSVLAGAVKVGLLPLMTNLLAMKVTPAGSL